MTLRWQVVGAAAALLLACRGERFIIGDLPDAGAGVAVAADAATDLVCPAPAAEGIPLVRAAPDVTDLHLGSWLSTVDGVESRAFPADSVQLLLSREAASLRFTGEAPMPVSNDPTAGYLCTSTLESCASEAGFVAGFDYRLVDGRSRGSTLSFGLYLDEPWQEWCRLQTPSERRMPGCEPSFDVEPAYDEARWAENDCAVRRGEEWSPMACDRLATIERGVCVCTADGCRAGVRQQPVHLRLMAPGSLEGALWFTAGRAQKMQFSRLP
jgi:hypothetical protein